MNYRTNSKDHDAENIRTEKDNLLRINQYYISQVSEMEVKLSEIKAAFQAKESETEHYKDQLRVLESELKKFYPGNYKTIEELEAQVMYLKEENSRLKQQSEELEDITDLKIKFEHALRMKQIFEEKYRDAKSQLIKAEMRKSEEGSIFEYIDDESTSIAKSQDLENHKESIQKTEAENKILREENENLKRKLKESEDKLEKLKNEHKKVLNEFGELKKSKTEDQQKHEINLQREKVEKTKLESPIKEFESEELQIEVGISSFKNPKIEKTHEEEDSTTPYRPFVSITDRLFKYLDKEILPAANPKKDLPRPNYNQRSNLEPIKTEDQQIDIKPFVSSFDRIAKANQMLNSENSRSESPSIKQSDIDKSSFEKKIPDFLIGKTENISQILKNPSLAENKTGKAISFNEDSSQGESFADEFPEEDELV
ncbi:unnamed protein product [Blepharisma stoltei]|uniref:Uncharacterized protein n=1 Tax=Blepharisma stoltei TaxID=1481888 RepID=A0AAU9IMW6_9CILI|nr:unnamed protein product [Blepharisma stoltei]